jgi:hypothetical protein
VIRVHDAPGKVIETHEQAGEIKQCCILLFISAIASRMFDDRAT